jgi:uncharacterized protein (DUF924 family)
MTTQDILDYWFGELTFDDWFKRNDDVDRTIRRRFLDTWRAWRENVPAPVLLEPDAALAAILVFDQFPRNMFRGTADAFATDPLALALARNALEAGFERAVPEERQRFFFMPFMHSEALRDQERCVALFGGPEAEEASYAVEHRDIVARFGRFPHRNHALGRTPTAEEITFLEAHEGFGQ